MTDQLWTEDSSFEPEEILASGLTEDEDDWDDDEDEDDWDDDEEDEDEVDEDGDDWDDDEDDDWDDDEW